MLLRHQRIHVSPLCALHRKWAACRPACQSAPTGAARAGSVPPCSSLSPPLPTRCCLPQRPMSNVIRAGLATGWWALMMTSFSSNMNSDLVKAYNIVLKVGGDAGGGLGADKGKSGSSHLRDGVRGLRVGSSACVRLPTAAALHARPHACSCWAASRSS